MIHPPTRSLPRLLAVVLFAALSWRSGLSQSSAPTDLVPISTIQGIADGSPYLGKWVDTFGVVTGVASDGFYLQDPTGDGNPASSDGIFVYTHRPPTVRRGDCVTVRRAYVDEYYEKTELSRIKPVEPAACTGSQVAATAIPVARLGVPPSQLYEATEGMLVTVDDLTGVVQGPTKRFANGEIEIAFLPDVWLPYVDGGRVFQSQADATPALMFLSNELGADLPDVNWGDRIYIGAAAGADDAVTALLDYNFGKYQLIPLPGSVVTSTVHSTFPPPAEVYLPSADGDEFTICTFNLLGLGTGAEQIPDETEYRAQLHKRALAISQALEGCTILGLQETGTPADAANLVELLRHDFGLDYDFASIPGPGTASAEFPLTNTLLARRDRTHILHAELRQGCSPTEYDVANDAGVCPAGTFALFNRPPLVVDLEIRAASDAPIQITVIDNHWKSKGGDERINLVQRTAQATHVAALVNERLAADPGARVVVLGDLNDYDRIGPVEALRTAVNPPLTHLYDWLPSQNRYTYIFNGGSQVLDHLLMTPNLAADVVEVRPVHINADFAYPAVTDAASVRHSSDHDPVLARVRFGPGAWLGGQLEQPGITVAVTDAAGQPLATAITDADGAFRVWNLTPGRTRVKLMAANGVMVTPAELTVDVVDGANTLPTVKVDHPSVALGVRAAFQTAAGAPIETADP